MKKYYVVLSDMEGNSDWRHPTEINATDKQDAFNAITSSCDPQFIKGIFSEEEYKAKFSNKAAQKEIAIQDALNRGEDFYNNGNDFMQAMINIATSQGEENSKKEKAQQEVITDVEIEKQTPIINEEPTQFIKQPIKNEVKYFTDNGIMFKIENGTLYKKCWETVPIREYSTEDGVVHQPEYRIINSETKKPYKTDKYEIQKLTWTVLTEN